jgi:hypothetical protein
MSPLIEPSETEFTKQVIEFAQTLGWRVLHIRPGMNRRGQWATPYQGDGKGWPDLFMVKGRRAIAAELKVRNEQPTAEQEAWLGWLSLAGIPAFVWHPADLDGEIKSVLSARQAA